MSNEDDEPTAEDYEKAREWIEAQKCESEALKAKVLTHLRSLPHGGLKEFLQVVAEKQQQQSEQD